MTNKEEAINGLLDNLFRQESGKLVAVLTRIFGAENIDLAEDVVQDAFVEAVRQWAASGAPENPVGWLYRVAKNKALNALNRDRYQRKYTWDTAHYLQAGITEEIVDQFFSAQEIADDQLRMIFTCCHPSVSPESQVALTLKTLCGFSLQEIAKAFLTSEETIHKRLVRARQKLREASILFQVPTGNELEQRLDTVLKTIYLLFNEGYTASTGNQLIRFELCREAIRLTEMIAGHAAMPDKSAVYALLSLMQLNAARFAARQNEEGVILTLAEQDRSLWSQELIQKGLVNMEKSAVGNRLTTYQVLAAISAYHCVAADFAATDWKSILSLYDSLLQLDNSPLVLLNRAIALAKVNGAEKGIKELEAIQETPALQSNHLFYLTQAELNVELNESAKAVIFFEKAMQWANLPAEKELIAKRLKTCREKITAP